MSPDVESAIVQAAQEGNIDPTFALAVAQRESNGNPNAHASRTIYGLFQMSGPLRSQYGAGDSGDPYTQAKGWTSFIGDLRNQMGDRLGRQPTDQELYLGHYFGGARAARLISGQVPPSADVRDVFTPQELAANPEFAKAGTVGRLMASVEGDIGQRQASFGGSPGYTGVHDGPDFASFGQPQDGTYKSTGSQPIDFAAFGAASTPVSGAQPAAEPQAAAQPAAPQEQLPAQPVAAPQETPATAAMRQAIQQRTGFGAGQTVAGIPAMPGQQAQTAAPLAPQQGSPNGQA